MNNYQQQHALVEKFAMEIRNQVNVRAKNYIANIYTCNNKIYPWKKTIRFEARSSWKKRI